MDFFEQIAALRREGQPFALATVVARRAPVSAHLGDRAIVFADGRMQGFVGGACSQEIVRRQALDAIRTRQPRLVSIQPDAAASAGAADGHVTVQMTCASEGAIDVYVEPFVQPRRLIVVGATPVAEVITRLARVMDYDVVRVVDSREQRDIEADAAALGVSVASIDALDNLVAEAASRGIEQAAVVASQGHYDEQALERILKHHVSYVGLVASRRRAATVFGVLGENGVEGIETIRNPAGLDLNAKTAAEVAVSILAEVVQRRATTSRSASAPRQHDVTVKDSTTATSLDPVCGMAVDVDGARHTAEIDGVRYYFCCARCRSRFLENPQHFLAAS
jgi:xanthine dehydrogenase accessory factor